METERPPHYQRNLAALSGDYIAFNVAMAFVDQSTVLPTFVSALTSSAPLVGLTSALHSGGWLLPQLFAASYVADKAKKKPYIVWPAALGRSLMPLMAIITYALGLRAPALVLGALYITQALFWVADGLASVPWFDVLAKAFPGNLRGRYLAISQVGGGVIAVGAGAVVRRILSADGGLAFPNNYALLIGLASVFFGLSFVSLLFLKEPPGSAHESRASLRSYTGMLVKAVRGDSRFALALAGRMLAGMNGLALPFFILHATEGLGLGPAVVGYSLTAKVVGSIAGGLLLGWSVERKGHRFTILGSVAVTCLSPLLAIVLPKLAALWGVEGSLLYLYPLVFLLMGISLSTVMWSFTHYVLDIAPPRDRPSYVGLTNTLGGLLVLAPVLGGALLEASSYEVLFGVAFVTTAASLVVSARLPKQHTGPVAG